jgi:hypothetical protein
MPIRIPKGRRVLEAEREEEKNAKQALRRR